MRTSRRNRKNLTPRQTYVFLGLLEKYSNCSLHDIEGVMDVVVIMPGHLLCTAELQLRNPKTWASSVVGATLHFVEPTRILHSLHGGSLFKRCCQIAIKRAAN